MITTEAMIADKPEKRKKLRRCHTVTTTKSIVIAKTRASRNWDAPLFKAPSPIRLFPCILAPHWTLVFDRQGLYRALLGHASKKSLSSS
jgi:hypothetical protein